MHYLLPALHEEVTRIQSIRHSIADEGKPMEDERWLSRLSKEFLSQDMEENDSKKRRNGPNWIRDKSKHLG
jgi:L-lactate utilization protein LutB